MSLKNTLKARRATHGDFIDHSRVSQQLCGVMRLSPNWDNLSDVHKESLEMIAHKIARILCGDPLFIDPFRDIAGYAQRVQEMLMTKEGASDVTVTKKVYCAGEWTKEKTGE